MGATLFVTKTEVLKTLLIKTLLIKTLLIKTQVIPVIKNDRMTYDDEWWHDLPMSF